jgi:hypothetical protein
MTVISKLQSMPEHARKYTRIHAAEAITAAALSVRRPNDSNRDAAHCAGILLCRALLCTATATDCKTLRNIRALAHRTITLSAG